MSVFWPAVPAAAVWAVVSALFILAAAHPDQAFTVALRAELAARRVHAAWRKDLERRRYTGRHAWTEDLAHYEATRLINHEGL